MRGQAKGGSWSAITLPRCRLGRPDWRVLIEKGRRRLTWRSAARLSSALLSVVAQPRCIRLLDRDDHARDQFHARKNVRLEIFVHDVGLEATRLCQ